MRMLLCTCILIMLVNCQVIIRTVCVVLYVPPNLYINYIKTDIVIWYIEGSHVLLNVSVNVVSCQKNICKLCPPTPC